MKYALVGYGKMGRAIEAAAATRGHDLVAIVDPSETGALARRSVARGRLGGAVVAFEFTSPSAAADNVRRLLECGLRVVSGTTGWDPAAAGIPRVAKARRSGAVIAPNFSVGMGLFYRAVDRAATLYGATGGFDPFVWEAHHRGKADAPSGTAIRLAEIVAARERRGAGIRRSDAAGRVPPGAVHVASVRAGHEPGTHVVGFDGEHDVVTLEHRARGRGGFALGAVLAGEWIVRRTGVHGFDAVLDALLRTGAGGRR